jgi:hypothetical protein
MHQRLLLNKELAAQTVAMSAELRIRMAPRAFATLARSAAALGQSGPSQP